MTASEIQKRAKGKVVLLGFDIDRVVGVFTSVDKAMKALSKDTKASEHNWWLEFRKMDRVETGLLFQRVLVRTKS